MSHKGFRENLKLWTKLQDKQNKYQKYLNKIKSKKNEIQPELIKYMQNNELENTQINSNYLLKLNKNNRYSIISKNLISNTLKKHIKNEKLIDDIINDLYSSRELKINYNLNITKKDNV